MSVPWRAYQEEAAEFFRSLGLRAETDVTVQGVRTKHDVDVVVTYERAGMTHVWLVECKHLSRPVTKDRVLALRAIVDDTGADRGIMLAERGYQSGAREAAQSANVHVTSIEDLRAAAWDELYVVELDRLASRVEEVSEALRLQLRTTRTRTASGGRSVTSRDELAPALRPTSTFELVGRLSLPERGIADARRDRFPVSVKFTEDGKRVVRAATRAEFLSGAGSEVGDIEGVVLGGLRRLLARRLHALIVQRTSEDVTSGG